MNWNDVLGELVGFVGQRVSLTVSVGESLLTATIYGVLAAGPEIEAGDFYLYVDTGSGVRVREDDFTSATWVDGPLGRELAIGFGDIVLNVKRAPVS